LCTGRLSVPQELVFQISLKRIAGNDDDVPWPVVRARRSCAQPTVARRQQDDLSRLHRDGATAVFWQQLDLPVRCDDKDVDEAPLLDGQRQAQQVAGFDLNVTCRLRLALADGDDVMLRTAGPPAAVPQLTGRGRRHAPATGS
jgi:hypothetical protein